MHNEVSISTQNTPIAILCQQMSPDTIQTFKAFTSSSCTSIIIFSATLIESMFSKQLQKKSLHAYCTCPELHFINLVCLNSLEVTPYSHQVIPCVLSLACSFASVHCQTPCTVQLKQTTPTLFCVIDCTYYILSSSLKA